MARGDELASSSEKMLRVAALYHVVAAAAAAFTAIPALQPRPAAGLSSTAPLCRAVSNRPCGLALLSSSRCRASIQMDEANPAANPGATPAPPDMTALANSPLGRVAPILMLGGLFWASTSFFGRYGSARHPLLIPLLIAQDLACLGLDFTGGMLKFGWRLAVFLFVGSLFLKHVVLKIVLAGGPIKAAKAAFFGTGAAVFGGVSSFLTKRELLGGLAAFFGKLARGCDDRCPEIAANPFAGMGGMGGMGGANPFGGMGGMGGLGGMGGMGGNPFGGGGNPFGGGGANPFEGMEGMDGANPFEAMFGGMEGMDGADNPFAGVPSGPFTPTSSAPGVQVNVRRPGQAPSGSPAAPAGSAGASARPKPSAASYEPPPRRAKKAEEEDGPVIDVDSQES